MIQAQYFHYEIIQIAPLSKLEEFKEHRRLRVFYEKGVKCVKCGIEATQLALGKGRNTLHWDVYTDDFYPLTVDHIIPKSKGGSDDMSNLQPMCCLCNWQKGNGDKPHSHALRPRWARMKRKRTFTDPKLFKIGDLVASRGCGKLLGQIVKIEINPKCPNKSIAAVIEGKPFSWYNLQNLYIVES